MGRPRSIRDLASRADLEAAFVRLDACAADPELISLARRCLAPEPADRPRDARAVAEGIATHLAGVQDRLKAVELARAEAQARAEEEARRARVERHRRRLTVALALALLGLAAAGGLGTVYYVQQRQARLGRAQGLLNRAAAALGRAERADEAEAAALLQEARVALDEARDVLGPAATGPAEQSRRSLVARLERAARLRTLLAALESIRGERVERRAARQVDRAYAVAFRDFGVDVDAIGPSSSRAFDGLPVRQEVAAALDAWCSTRLQLGGGRDEPSWETLSEVARAIDPDPWRCDLRSQFGRPRGELVDALRRLAGDAEPLSRQPAPSLILLVEQLDASHDWATTIRVLREASYRFRSDFWINFELGDHLSAAAKLGLPETVTGERDAGAEALRHFTVAAAVRPRSPMARWRLGDELRLHGNAIEAIPELREAIRLEPDHAYKNFALVDALAVAGRKAEAVAEYAALAREQPGNVVLRASYARALLIAGAFDRAAVEAREAVRLEPSSGDLQQMLAWVYFTAEDRNAAIDAYREAIRLGNDNSFARKELGLSLDRTGRLVEAADASTARSTPTPSSPQPAPSTSARPPPSPTPKRPLPPGTKPDTAAPVLEKWTVKMCG